MTLYLGYGELTLRALLCQTIKEDFQHIHQKQALSRLKQDLLLLNNGEIIARAWDRRDLDGILCAPDFLEAYQSKTPKDEEGKNTEGIMATRSSILDKLITYTDEQGCNTFQMSILLEQKKQNVSFSDAVPQKVISWLNIAQNRNNDDPIVKNAILHKNEEGSTSLHLLAYDSRCRSLLLNVIRGYLQDDPELPKYLDQENNCAGKPLTIAIEHNCLQKQDIQWLFQLRAYTPQIMEMKVVLEKHPKRSIVELIITKGYTRIMEDLLSIECEKEGVPTLCCKEGLRTRLKDVEFQKRLRTLSYSVKMRDTILTAVEEAVRMDFTGLITPRTSASSQMHAIVFINDEETSQTDGKLMISSLQRLNFEVQTLHFNQWNNGQLIASLKSKLTDIAESCTKLLLVGISHGEVGSVIDPNEERVPISHMEQAIHESNLSPYTPKVGRGCLTVYYSHRWYSHNSTPNMIMFSLSDSF